MLQLIEPAIQVTKGLACFKSLVHNTKRHFRLTVRDKSRVSGLSQCPYAYEFFKAVHDEVQHFEFILHLVIFGFDDLESIDDNSDQYIEEEKTVDQHVQQENRGAQNGKGRHHFLDVKSSKQHAQEFLHGPDKRAEGLRLAGEKKEIKLGKGDKVDCEQNKVLREFLARVFQSEHEQINPSIEAKQLHEFQKSREGRETEAALEHELPGRDVLETNELGAVGWNSQKPLPDSKNNEVKPDGNPTKNEQHKLQPVPDAGKVLYSQLPKTLPLTIGKVDNESQEEELTGEDEQLEVADVAVKPVGEELSLGEEASSSRSF